MGVYGVETTLPRSFLGGISCMLAKGVWIEKIRSTFAPVGLIAQAALKQVTYLTCAWFEYTGLWWVEGERERKCYQLIKSEANPTSLCKWGAVRLEGKWVVVKLELGVKIGNIGRKSCVGCIQGIHELCKVNVVRVLPRLTPPFLNSFLFCQIARPLRIMATHSLDPAC